MYILKYFPDRSIYLKYLVILYWQTLIHFVKHRKINNDFIAVYGLYLALITQFLTFMETPNSFMLLYLFIFWFIQVVKIVGIPNNYNTFIRRMLIVGCSDTFDSFKLVRLSSTTELFSELRGHVCSRSLWYNESYWKLTGLSVFYAAITVY